MFLEAWGERFSERIHLFVMGCESIGYSDGRLSKAKAPAAVPAGFGGFVGFHVLVLFPPFLPSFLPSFCPLFFGVFIYPVEGGML